MNDDNQVKQESEEINTDTLEVVFTEAKDAYSKLMADVDTFHSKADQQTQISLIIMGIYLTVGGGIVASGMSVLLPLVSLSTILLAISVSLCVYTRARGEFYAGTIYPNLLIERLAQKPEQVKRDLLETVSSSYYYNLATLLKKRQLLTLSVYFQIAGILLPIVAVLIEAIILVVRG